VKKIAAPKKATKPRRLIPAAAAVTILRISGQNPVAAVVD
jgi:hypothetical protein